MATTSTTLPRGQMPSPMAPTSLPAMTPGADQQRLPSRTVPFGPFAPGRRPMREYTPANSSYEEPIGPTPRQVRIQMVLRVANATAHFAAAIILMVIMGKYLKAAEQAEMDSGLDSDDSNAEDIAADDAISGISWDDDAQSYSMALFLIVVLGIDAAIDIIFAVLIRLRWNSLGLLPRLIFGIGYLAVFMAYLGLGTVFPTGYSYWNLQGSYSGPVVYLFLWLLGVWDMLHVCMHRHRLGLDYRASCARYTVWRARYAIWRERNRTTPSTQGDRTEYPVISVAAPRTGNLDVEASGALENRTENIPLAVRDQENKDSASESATTTSDTPATEETRQQREIR